MTPEFTNQLPFFAAGGVAALIAWLWLRSRGKPGKLKKIPQYMFSARGTVKTVHAESIAGVMMTENDGGQFENPAAVCVHRKGRLWFKTVRDPGVFRQRRLVYATRQGDSSVLDFRALFDPAIPLTVKHDNKKDLRPRKNLAARKAMSDAVLKPGSRDLLTRRLSLAAIATVVLGALAWIVVTVMASLQV